MKDLTKQYASLTAPERISLFIEARARGDTQESKNIAATCPHANYRMADTAFTDRLLMLQTIAYVHAARFFQARGCMLSGCALIALEPSNKESAALYQLRHAEFLAYGEGWARFCHEIGLDPPKVLAAFHLELDDLLDGYRPGIEPDANLTEWLYLDYLKTWNGESLFQL